MAASRKICKVACIRICSLLFIYVFAAANCSFSTAVENGNVTRANSNSTVGQITCNKGYKLLGYSTVVCQGTKLRSSSTCEGEFLNIISYPTLIEQRQIKKSFCV